MCRVYIKNQESGEIRNFTTNENGELKIPSKDVGQNIEVMVKEASGHSNIISYETNFIQNEEEDNNTEESKYSEVIKFILGFLSIFLFFWIISFFKRKQ